jgi:hypothetical protein
MVRHGEEPYLECSSAGDSRFSAFKARVSARGNLTIEEIYQGAKVFQNGVTGLSWRDAKGKKPINPSVVRQLYSELWDEYIRENPRLLIDLRKASGLSDKFGQPKHACQATELWRIRNDPSFVTPGKRKDIEEEEI